MTSRSDFRLTKALIASALLVWVGVAAMLAAPEIEARLAPVRVDQRVEDVTRSTERLCWAWVSRKVLARATDDLDVFLHAEGIDGRMVVSLFGEADGLPWRSSQATGLGPLRKRWCVEVPAGVPADAPVWLEQTIWYPSLTRLWRVPLRVPVVGASRATDGEGGR